MLEPVTGDWATPLVPVMKKDGTLRNSGDCKVTVNPVLVNEQCRLPDIDDLFTGLAGGQKFSKIYACESKFIRTVDCCDTKKASFQDHL